MRRCRRYSNTEKAEQSVGSILIRAENVSLAEIAIRSFSWRLNTIKGKVGKDYYAVTLGDADSISLFHLRIGLRDDT